MLFYEKGVIYSVEKQARKAFADAKFFFFELFSLKFAYFQPFFSVRGETSNFFFFVCFFSCAAWFTSLLYKLGGTKERKNKQKIKNYLFLLVR